MSLKLCHYSMVSEISSNKRTGYMLCPLKISRSNAGVSPSTCSGSTFPVAGELRCLPAKAYCSIRLRSSPELQLNSRKNSQKVDVKPKK